MSANYMILRKGKPIAWFKRRHDATELLCQLQWETGPHEFTLAKQSVVISKAND